MPDYNYSLLKNILNIKINNTTVWKKRIKLQTQFLHLLDEAFDTDLSSQAFGFYPKRIYFSTPLTSDPEYTKKMKPFWHSIIKILTKQGWDIYAPFDKSDPHSKIPDNLNSNQIRDLDHIKILQAEISLVDLNRPSHGVGQEMEMSMFMPTIGFSQNRVSRLTKGMPGNLILTYTNEKELLHLLKKIFTRTNFKKEPFYLTSCPKHAGQSIFKGKECLCCSFDQYLHQM
jgi:hypothetical protein